MKRHSIRTIKIFAAKRYRLGAKDRTKACFRRKDQKKYTYQHLLVRELLFA